MRFCKKQNVATLRTRFLLDLHRRRIVHPTEYLACISSVWRDTETGTWFSSPGSSFPAYLRLAYTLSYWLYVPDWFAEWAPPRGCITRIYARRCDDKREAAPRKSSCVIDNVRSLFDLKGLPVFANLYCSDIRRKCISQKRYFLPIIYV